MGSLPNSDLHPLVKALCHCAPAWHTDTVHADTKPSSTGHRQHLNKEGTGPAQPHPSVGLDPDLQGQELRSEINKGAHRKNSQDPFQVNGCFVFPDE